VWFFLVGMSDTAMRNADGNIVFVREDGSYTTEFPEEAIIREENSTATKFVVYGFVGTQSNFEEQRWVVGTEQEAIQKATDIYGSQTVPGFTRNGEVFDVEVHEVSKETAQELN
jgi:hypothetical protein